MHGVTGLQKWQGAISIPAGYNAPLLATRASAMVPQGPVYTLEVSGGACTEDPRTGLVTCTQPAVTLSKAAGGCSLAHTGPSLVQACPPGALLSSHCMRCRVCIVPGCIGLQKPCISPRTMKPLCSYEFVV